MNVAARDRSAPARSRPSKMRPPSMGCLGSHTADFDRSWVAPACPTMRDQTGPPVRLRFRCPGRSGRRTGRRCHEWSWTTRCAPTAVPIPAPPLLSGGSAPVGDLGQVGHEYEPPYPDRDLRPVAEFLRVNGAEPLTECGNGNDGLVRQFGTSP